MTEQPHILELTISLGPVLQTEGEGQLGLILEELGGEGVPPEVVRLLSPLLQPLVHLKYPVVGLQYRHRPPVMVNPNKGKTKYNAFTLDFCCRRLAGVVTCR